MPPVKASKMASQRSAMERSVQELCKQLTAAAKIKGNIEIPDEALNSVAEALKSNDVINAVLCPGLLSVLETNANTCERLGAKIFCTALNIALKTKSCRESNRILVLLAKALHKGFRIGSSPPRKVFDDKIIKIAKTLKVDELMRYFVDIQQPPATRRWVGVILLQLLRGPEAIYSEFQHTPEDIRRSLGPLIIGEDNEILRMLCGQIVQGLINSDIAPGALWPENAGGIEYEQFPTASQSQTDWKTQFQNWVDGSWPKEKPTGQVQILYFSHSVTTTPPHRIGNPGENVEVVFERDMLLLFASSTDQNFVQILEIPCHAIRKVELPADTGLPIGVPETHKVNIELRSEDQACYLNCSFVQLQKVEMITSINPDDGLLDHFHGQCPDAEISDMRICRRVSMTTEALSVDGSELAGSDSEAEDGYEDVDVEENAENDGATADPFASGAQYKGREDQEYHESTLASVLGDDLSSPEVMKAKSPTRNKARLEQEDRIYSEADEAQELNDDEVSPLIMRSNSSRHDKGRIADQSQPKRSDLQDFSDSPTMQTIQKNRALMTDKLPKAGSIKPQLTSRNLARRNAAENSEELSDETIEVGQPNFAMARKPNHAGAKASQGVATNTKKAGVSRQPKASQSQARAQPEIFQSQAEASHPRPKASQPQPNASQMSDNKDNLAKQPKGYSVKPKTPIQSAASLNAPPVPEAGEPASAPAPARPTKAPVTQSSIYDLPPEDDIKQPTKKGKSTKGAKGAKKGPGPQAKAKTAGKDLKKAKPAARKSVVKEQANPARGSQRAAASQAKLNMRRDAEEEELSDGRDSGPSQPNVSRKRKIAGESAASVTPAGGSASVGFGPLTSNQDEQDFELQRQDAQRLGLVDDDAVRDNFSDSGANFIADDSPEPVLANTIQPSQNDEDRKNDGQNKDKGLNFAKKFANYMDGDVEKDVLRVSSSRGETVKQNETLKESPSQRPKTSRPSKASKLPEEGPPLVQAHVPDAKTEVEKQNQEDRFQSRHSATGMNAENVPRTEQDIVDDKAREPTSLKDQTTTPTEKVTNKCEVNPASQLQPEIEPNHKDHMKSATKSIGSATRQQNPNTTSSEKENHVPLPPSVPITEPESSPAKGAAQHIIQQDIAGDDEGASMIADTKVQVKPGRKIQDDQDIVSKSNEKPPKKKRKSDVDPDAPPKRQKQDPSMQAKTTISPREGTHHAELLHSSGRKSALLDDSTIRKPHLIHFGRTGARNQGSSTMANPSTPQFGQRLVVKPTREGESEAAVTIKRRRDDDDDDEDGLFVSQSPPKKRQSTSPPDSTPLKEVVSAPLNSVGSDSSSLITITPSKPSSQTAKVDAFGSPMAVAPIYKADNGISKVQQKLQLSEVAIDRTPNVQQELLQISETDRSQRVHTPDILGPRVKIASIAKVRPALPGDLPVRYIPHTKTQNGYEGIMTLDSVQEEESLPDPFIEPQDHQSNQFMERLRAGRASATNAMPESKKEANASSKTLFLDPEKTLVESSASSPSMTDGSSSPSRSASREPSLDFPDQEWSLAVRPHYQRYSEAVHRVADEMVIRLANEEDASMLIVKQYDESGIKILDGLSKDRSKEKIKIQNTLAKRVNVVMGIYSASSRYMVETQKDLETSSIGGEFEQEWRKRQEAIQKHISNGRHRTE